MGYPTSAQGMRFSADARWLKCPGGHVRDSVPLLGVLAAIWLPRSHTFGCERAFNGTHGSPGARRSVGSFQQAGVAACAPEASPGSSRDPPTGQLGLADGVRRCDSARFASRRAPKRRRSRGASTIRGAAGGGRDAENSGFCTVQAGVRWDGEVARLFMHVASKIMQDIGHHATDTQIGRAMRRRSSRAPSTSYANQKVRAVMGVLAALWRRGCNGACACRGRPGAVVGAGARRAHAPACHARCRRRSGPRYLGYHRALNTNSATK